MAVKVAVLQCIMKTFPDKRYVEHKQRKFSGKRLINKELLI